VRSRTLIATGLIVTALTVAPTGHADGILKIGVYSQNVPGRGPAIGATIQTRAVVPARPSPRTAARRPGSSAAAVPLYPAIVSTSPFLENPAPLGPGSFWYVDGGGHSCTYLPDSVLPCFRVVMPGGGGVSSPGVSPAGVAESIASGLSLSAGEIHVSPTAGGLTGAASWFWLDPAPGTSTVSVTLGGESVTVTAEPEVKWRFGDGGSAGGAGVAYRRGPAPSEAVTHVYGTRCLPGDRGRDPYVLESCGAGGYTVEAVVTWRVSFSASGLISASGGLATRTTDTSVAYPVSEARAFLIPSGSR
jgi:hypothetical protein